MMLSDNVPEQPAQGQKPQAQPAQQQPLTDVDVVELIDALQQHGTLKELEAIHRGTELAIETRKKSEAEFHRCMRDFHLGCAATHDDELYLLMPPSKGLVVTTSKAVAKKHKYGSIAPAPVAAVPSTKTKEKEKAKLKAKEQVRPKRVAFTGTSSHGVPRAHPDWEANNRDV